MEDSNEPKQDREFLNKGQKTIAEEMFLFRKNKSKTLYLEDEIRLKSPGKARKADYEGSRTAAIELFCQCCMQSKSAPRDCESVTCFLWPFRLGADNTVRPPGMIPTLSQYQRLLEMKTTETQRAAREVNAARLRKADAEESDE